MDAESEFIEVLKHHFPRTKDAKIAEVIADLIKCFDGPEGITDALAHIPVRTIELANAVIEVDANDCMVNVLTGRYGGRDMQRPDRDGNSDVQVLL